MTTTPNKSDFTEQLAAYDAKKAIDKAFNDAPAVAKAKQGLVPTPKKAAPKAKGKAGRIVGISAAENAYIQEVLQMIADDAELGSSNPNYVKIQARYNK